MNSENGLLAIDETSLPLCSGLYIDVENLHPDGQAVIDALIDGWPPNWPTPSRLNLYTRADQAELWRVWAEHRFGNLQVAAHGTQHFSWSATKNSADIAIAINAISDLVLGRVDNVVVLSDDSDFISLYVAIRDEPGIPRIDNRPPFLWAVTDRKGPLSTTVEQFFPPTHLHIVSGERGRPSRPAAAPVETPRPPQMQSPRPPQMQSRPVAPTALAPVEAPRPPQMQPSSVAPPVVSPVAPPVIARRASRGIARRADSYIARRASRGIARRQLYRLSRLPWHRPSGRQLYRLPRYQWHQRSRQRNRPSRPCRMRVQPPLRRKPGGPWQGQWWKSFPSGRSRAQKAKPSSESTGPRIRWQRHRVARLAPTSRTASGPS